MEDIDVESLLNKINIVDYISQYAELQYHNGCYWCCSPLNKNDTEPSFSIDVEKQLFYCFSTKRGGNVINFVELYNHVSFQGALKILCEYVGGSVTEHKSHLLSSIKEIKKYKHIDKQKEIKYKILPKDIMLDYCSDEDKLEPWQKEGISLDIMKKYQVKFDEIQNRIVYPIFDINGNIINISGRTVDKDYREKRIRKYTYYYSMGVIDTFYNLSQRYKEIKEKGSVLIFEGAKSVLLCESWGITNAIAAFTSTINEEQIKLLVKMGIDVVLAFDEDVDVTKDSRIKTLSRFTNVRYIWNYNNLLKEKQSPVDNGIDVFRQLYINKKRF